VTVEVNDGQAEQIAVASEMGKISMSLRSINASGEEPAGQTKTTEGDVSKMVGGGMAPRVRVIRGDQVENMEFSQ
jgi:Flp pilus assembly protein CpaB